jgi:ferredoxin-nitrite reductase
VWSNLPRKFNIAVSGSRDDFAHTHINDIGFQPCVHATTGEMGFNIVLGGYMSTKRVAESVDMNLWIPANVDCAVELSTAILRLFRDEGERKDRQKARLMWMVENAGPVEEVDGHLRAHDDYRKMVVNEMASYGNGFDKMVDVQQPRPTEPFERTGSPASIYLGVHAQKQEGLSWVGIHVPVGRLSVSETRQIADLAEKYNPNGEIRLTVEQNAIIPNVKDEDVAALLAEPALNSPSRLSVQPGRIVGNMVSCTGAQFCGFAMIETKQNAETITQQVQDRLDLDRDVRIHWTGCPNSCGQVQAADIGLMGGPAKKFDPASGKMKAVPGVKMFVGGTIGEHGQLQLKAEPQAYPIEELVPHLTDLVIDKFGGRLKPEYEEEQAAFHAEQAKAKEAATAKAA